MSRPISRNWHWLIVYWSAISSAHSSCFHSMFYFIISFMSFYCRAIIYNLPGLPSTGLISPPKESLFPWEWLPKIRFNFRAANCPNCRLQMSPCLYLFWQHMCCSAGFFMDVHTPSSVALMWIITEPHHCPQLPCQHLLMFPVCTSR